MTPDQLRRRISKLSERQPLTIRLERSLATADPSRRPPWYRSQKEHWLGWLREYDGPGYFGRRDWGRSAEFVYNHVVCPPMVLVNSVRRISSAFDPKQTLWSICLVFEHLNSRC